MPVTLTSEKVALDRIKIPSGREPDEPTIRELMVSISEIGMLQPIICRRPSPGMGIELVFGLQRLIACKRLRHTALLSRVVNGNSDEIRAWCVQAQRDENSIRNVDTFASETRSRDTYLRALVG